MQVKIQYGTAVTVLPAIPLAVLSRATAADLRLLLHLCRPGLSVTGADMDALCADLAAAVGCGAVQVAASLAFWRGAGVLELDGATAGLEDTAETTAEPAADAAKPEAQPIPSAAQTVAPAQTVETTPAATDKPRKTIPHDRLPRYTMDEINDLLEARAETAQYIHECEAIWGKLFNTMEVNIILGLSDYLGLEWDYILALLAHCAKELGNQSGGRSMRYVEKMASGLYDDGIRTHDALLDKLRCLEELRSMEGKLRTLFGMGDRAWTPKEEKCFSTWLYDYRYNMDIIRLAYEITVDTKGSLNMNYMNSILANWNKDGLRTKEEIQAAQEAFRTRKETQRTAGNKKGTPAPAGSFVTEDFFDAAVRRSFGESDPTAPEGKKS